MENIVLSLLINGMMAVLLLVTILYCWKLNGRIRLLQDSKSELARIIREFNESTERATQSIVEIHAATDRISENIQHKIDKANFIVTDLDMMIEKGQRLTGGGGRNTAADAPRPARPEAVMPTRSARAPSALAAAQGDVASISPLADAAEPAARRGNRPRSRAEQELLNMLQSKKTEPR